MFNFNSFVISTKRGGAPAHPVISTEAHESVQSGEIYQ